MIHWHFLPFGQADLLCYGLFAVDNHSFTGRAAHIDL